MTLAQVRRLRRISERRREVSDEGPIYTSFESAGIELWNRSKRLGNPLAISAIAIITFYVRCLSVARFDVDEARLIFVQTTLQDALRSLAFLLIPWLLAMSIYPLGSFGGSSWRLRGIRHPRTVSYLVAAPIMLWIQLVLDGSLKYFIDWPYLGEMLLLVLFGILITRFIPLSITVAKVWLLAALVGFTIAGSSSGLSNAQMWLPLEQFKLSDGKVMDAYLLKTSEGQFMLLDEASRRVVSVNKDRVQARSVCHFADICDDPIPPPSSSPSPSPSPSRSGR